MIRKVLANKCHKVAESLYHDMRCDNDQAHRLAKGIRELMCAADCTPAEFFWAVSSEAGFILANGGEGTKELINNLEAVWEDA